ncbi:rCG30437, partial [Rattus norvegicus]
MNHDERDTLLQVAEYCLPLKAYPQIKTKSGLGEGHNGSLYPSSQHEHT